MTFQAPAIEIVDSLIIKAYKLQASDIHLEPLTDKLRVRFRVDGILHDQDVISKEFMLLVISRIKVLALMNVAERRIPQDGKIAYTIFDTCVLDLRIATFPGVYGEKIVMRLLDQASHTLMLTELGFKKSIITQLELLVHKISGFLLVVGPTGSGKTTTLYSLLSLLKSQEKNITTLEDPVEYTLEGIVQGHIHPEIGFTFAKGIRSILRQDPDIIMVGEIRDQETARIALQAALTGHLVLSTLHTGSASSTVMRLLDMGIEPYLLNASLTGVLAQRLLKKLCSKCRYKASLTDLDRAIIKRFKLSITFNYSSKGCTDCKFLGHKGRIVVSELLTITHKLRALLTKEPIFEHIYYQACQDGMVPLTKKAIELVDDGIISLKELLLLID